MQVISIVQQKGGAGKTTLAVNLAGELRARGGRVVLADADPQASAVAWAAQRKLEFAVRAEPFDSFSTSQWIRNILKLSADIAVVDTPAGLGGVFQAAVDIADVIIVPCGPSNLDVNAARATLSAIAAAGRRDPGSRARAIAVPTRVDPQTPESQQLVQELEALGEPVGPALSHDIYYVRAFAQGVAVCTAAPSSRAAAEVRDLADFVLERLR